MRIAVIATPYPLEEFPSPPLGISYVAAAFAKAGCEARIFDYIISSYSREKLARQLAEFQPDAVGVGCVTLNFYEAQRILRDVKSCEPDILTMIGGPHVSFTAEETLRRYPDIDVVFIGEADDTIIEFAPLIYQKEKWPDIAGIAYRREGRIIRTGKRELLRDINLAPLPSRGLLSSSRYRALGFPVSMITGRGCPHGCIFCVGRRMVGAKVRRRDPQQVLDEIEEILNLGYERINIADDLFASDTERVKIICDGIRQRDLKFIWSAFARVDTVSQEMFDAMASVGCDSVSFGVESGNPEMLKRIRKGIKLQQVRQAVQMCKQAGMIPHASFMVGLPGETRETLRQTAEFAKSLDIQYGYHYLTPFPGTTLSEKINRYDLEILTQDWSKYDANDAIVRTSELTPQDIRDFVALYDDEVARDWQKVLDNYKTGKNSPYDDMRVEGNRRMHITFKILKQDLVEKHGLIPSEISAGANGRAADILAQRIQQAITDEPEIEIVEKTVRDFINRGYLQADLSDKDIVWRWA